VIDLATVVDVDGELPLEALEPLELQAASATHATARAAATHRFRDRTDLTGTSWKLVRLLTTDD
jgi:hypothetical protein